MIEHRAPRSVPELARELINRGLLAVVVAVMVAGLVAFAAAEYERTRTPVYESTAVLLLDSPLAITSNPGTVVAVAEIRAKYVGLVGTDVIAQPAAVAAGVTPAVVARSVSATLGPVNLNIYLRARGLSPKQSQKLAASVAQSMIDYLHTEQAALPPGFNPALRLSMKVIGAPVEGGRVSPNHRRELTTGAIFGLVTLAAVYVLARIALGVFIRPTAPASALPD